MASLAPGGSPPPPPLDPNDPILTNPTVALAVQSFRNMRSAALTPVARRLRDIMIKRHQQRQLNALQPPVEQPAPAVEWTEVSIACPPPGTRLNNKGKRLLIPPGQLLRDTLGAEVLLLLGALLAFLGSAVTLLATYGRFGSPESRPTVMGLGPPLVGIGFLFCMLRLFFCRPQRLRNACCGWLLAARRVHPASRAANHRKAAVAAVLEPGGGGAAVSAAAAYDATRFSQTWTIT